MITVKANFQVIFYRLWFFPAALRGKLKDLTSSGGANATLTYNAANLLASVNWTDAAGAQVDFAYTYYADAERSGLMESALFTVTGAQVRKVFYDYYVSGDSHGPAGTLKSADVRCKEDGVWHSIGKNWYRYYTSTGGGAVLYGMKLRLQDNGTAAAEAVGIDLRKDKGTASQRKKIARIRGQPPSGRKSLKCPKILER